MTEKPSDVIFVGNKPPMSYVLAIITAFSGSQKEITLKARGQSAPSKCHHEKAKTDPEWFQQWK
jgi:DNA-binding protein